MIKQNFIAGIFLQSGPIDVPESFKKSFDFLQGNGVYEQGVMHFLKGMKNTIWTHFDTFIADAQALCAIFMLIFFAIKAYEMIAGDKKMEIMPLLRPFGLVMVILWWGTFIRVVAYPTDIIAAKSESLFDRNESAVNALRYQRAKLMVDISDQLLTVQAETEIADKEATGFFESSWETVKSTVKEGFSKVWNPIIELRNRMQIGFQLLISSLMESAAVWILRICVYIIFIIQIIYSTILVILGPFSVAVSIVPAFRDSFSTWIARFISVNLYSGIAYLVMYVGSLFQQYALEAEITRYQELLSSPSEGTMGKLFAFANNGVLSFGIVIVVFLISGLTMLTVPSISTWIVSTSGISSAVGTMSRGYAQMSRFLVRLARKF